MTTVAQAFAGLNLPEWWNLHISQFFGQNSEEGEDYNFGSFGRPVGSITGGRVVYVGDGGYPGSSIGQIVQILTPGGQLIHYQHLMTSNVLKGQIVQVGTVIGTGGGCPVGAYGSGTSCTRTDQFSTGEHIEVRYAPNYNAGGGVWSQAWQAPASIFKAMAGQATTDVASASSNANAATGAGSPPIGATLISSIQSAGVKIGVFLLALVLVGAGFYLLFSKQIDAAGGAAAKTAIKAALL